MNAQALIAQAKEFGASLAGVARVADLQKSSSYDFYRTGSYYEGCPEFVWPQYAISVLVMALEHKPSEPELDWWGPKIRGETLGNSRLIDLARSMKQWLLQEHGIKGRPLRYHVENGGVFLKDSSVLAGLGIIGKNNLLITPEFGPRVRLRALFLDLELEPTGPLDSVPGQGGFDPCEACTMPCHSACPKKAFESGSYHRPACLERLRKYDEHHQVLVEDWVDGLSCEVIVYCRACELACPVAC